MVTAWCAKKKLHPAFSRKSEIRAWIVAYYGIFLLAKQCSISTIKGLGTIRVTEIKRYNRETSGKSRDVKYGDSNRS